MSETLAVIAGKLSAQTIRLLGLGLASNLPGKVSRKINPAVLSHLAAQAREGVVAVSGTNGKSTTAGLLASILHHAGKKLVHNRQGANLVAGITACVVDSASWSGSIDADYCLFEIDEAALPLVAKEIKIDSVLVTNLFRDQLDRFGELDTTAKLISKGIDQNHSNAVLNADDPNVAQMVPGSRRVFYGIKSLSPNEQSALESVALEASASSKNSELSYCASCGEEYSYTIVFYGQLGHYACRKCANKRPEPGIYAENVSVKAGASSFDLVYANQKLEISLPLPGMFNVYNALAAAALAVELAIPAEAVKSGLCEYSTLFGRSEKLSLGGKHLLIQLIKNPAGASQAVSAAAADPDAKFLIAINDNYADGRDVSWLWDADFELLSSCPGPFVVSGNRCNDMAVRLKYAGVDPSKITVESELSAAIDAGLALCKKDSDTLWLMPTYTCLLELQKIMKTRGCPLSGT
ncbi:MAG: MurT ligase domain-containing protein [Candidatus Obscuribacterales bacterium]|nr:MurT ligase domain-containing protein [Candidatus Obscuribacterales bacterium]